MTDLARATQTALYQRLSSTVTLAPVFQHVPERTAPPVVIVGEIVIDPVGAKDGRFERHEVDIVTVIEGPARLPLYAVQDEVRAAIDGIALPAQSGVELSPPVLLSSTAQLLEDVTYYGSQRFLIFAQPA